MYAEMRGNMEALDNIMMQIEDLSSGQMINMYEVHVKDMAAFDTQEKIEELRTKDDHPLKEVSSLFACMQYHIAS